MIFYRSYKWIIPVLISTLFTSCTRKNYSSRSQDTVEAIAANDSKERDRQYTPPAYITLSDDQARSNKDGELYYIDPNGYRYWKFCDGKYYLDSKQEREITNNTDNNRSSKRKNKRKRKTGSEEEI